MSRTKTKIRYVNTRFSSEWILAGVCIILGMIGLQFSYNFRFLNYIMHTHEISTSIGTVVKIDGQIQYERKNHSAPQYTHHSTTIFNGNSILTGEKGVALFTLKMGAQLKLFPKTKLSISVESDTQPDDMTLGSFLNPWFSESLKPGFILNLQEGTVEISLNEKLKNFKILAKSLPFEFWNDNPTGIIKLEVKPDQVNPVIVMTPNNISKLQLKFHPQKPPVLISANRKWSVMQNGAKLELVTEELSNDSLDISNKKTMTPFIPDILGPTQGARFISDINEKEEVILRWKQIPSDLTSEVEVRRFDDPDFKASPQVMRSGATVSLPDGTYNWKIRTTNTNNQRSEWSPTHEFTIQESTRGSIPRTLLQPTN